MEMNLLKRICREFLPEETVLSIDVIPFGHINSTYKVATEKRDYILQRINTDIFVEYEALIRNIEAVTEFLRKKIIQNGGDPERETLTLLKADGEKSFYRDESGVYRMYLFITDAICFNKAERKGLFGESAKAFGRFQKLLSDFDANLLSETLTDFHNTEARFSVFEKSVRTDRLGRTADCVEEIEFVLSQKDYCSLIVERLNDGRLPMRVTHNDTKLNNVMIDRESGTGICVIDLDTVMPGSLLYDFGDSIRFGASSASEDEKDLDKVFCVPELYEEYAEGFLSEMREFLTDEEKRLLHDGAVMMTLECGMRFLTDYLEGDTYFKTHYAGQNLDRARTQIKLVKDMNARRELFDSIIKKHL